MKKFIFIVGCSGSGKSTLARNFLLNDFCELNDSFALIDFEKFYVKNSPFGKYTISRGGKVVSVGSYRCKCGGADTITNDYLYYSTINYLIENFNGDVVVEGLMNRSFEKIRSLFENVAEKKFSVNLIKLNLPLNVCVDRVIRRSGRKQNEKNIIGKINSFNSFFEKFMGLKKFNCFEVDCESKTEIEIFQEVMKKLK